MDSIEIPEAGNGQPKWRGRRTGKNVAILVNLSRRSLRELALLQTAMIVNCTHDVSREQVNNEASSIAAKQKNPVINMEETE